VYTGKKQSTAHSVKEYWLRSKTNEKALQEISECTQQIIAASDLTTFMEIMRRHEDIMSGLLGQEPLHATRFAKFPGQTKSLGAWGGDFILAASPDPEQARKFLQDAGFVLNIPFHNLLLCPIPTEQST